MNTTRFLSKDSLMPFGKYKGQKMSDVPTSYLQWLCENNRCRQDVADYVKRNIKN